VNAFNTLSILTTADFDIDTGFGHTPWTVNFTNASPNAPSAPYLYAFGDGDEAMTADAMHTYTEPGVFDVSFTGSGPSGPHTRTYADLIVAVEDTIHYQSILLPSANGSKAPLPIRLRNTHPMSDIYIPFRFTGSPNVFIDSLTRGPRIPGWSINLVFDNRFAGQIAWRLSAGSAASLPAGEGIVANVWVRSGAGNDPGEVEIVDSARYTTHYLHLKSKWVDFIPDFVPGTITIYNPCACPFQGDFDEDTFLTSVDLGAVIDVLFAGAPDLKDGTCPVPRADLDCDLFSTSLDLSLLIDYLFAGGAGPCDPCAR
jgi:PKD repeat protein